MICKRPDAVDAYLARAQDNGWPGMELNAIRGGVAMQRGDLEHAEELYLAAMPANAAQVRMSFAAIRHRKIDAAARAMLASQPAYGPPGAGRFPVEVQVPDVDAAIATLYGTVAADSLLAPDGSGGPVRMSEGYQGTAHEPPRRGLVDAAGERWCVVIRVLCSLPATSACSHSGAATVGPTCARRRETQSRASSRRQRRRHLSRRRPVRGRGPPARHTGGSRDTVAESLASLPGRADPGGSERRQQ